MIVGASGSGKSSTAALLLKLYEAGTTTRKFQYLTISNCAISALHTSTLRSHISVVSQTPVLFPRTVAENIAYAMPASDPRASPFAIKAAATAAGIADFIASLPQGYETLIGEGGAAYQADRRSGLRLRERC